MSPATSRGTSSSTEIVTATGNTLENGAANYWVIHRDPLDTSENMAQAFLGINITCAHCHNHPLAKWTQKDYYGMANLFARVRLKTFAPSGTRPAVGPLFNDVTVYSAPTGEFIDDRFMMVLPPKPLDAKQLCQRGAGRHAHLFCQVAYFAGEPVLCPQHRQPDLAQLYGARTG